MVTWGGGDLVNTARVAAVVVGEFCHVGDSNTPHFVAGRWILDSVQNNMVMPFLDYPLEWLIIVKSRKGAIDMKLWLINWSLIVKYGKYVFYIY